MTKCAKTRALEIHHYFSAVFWLSVPVLSYLYPLFNGHGHTYAWHSFCFANAGLASWVVIRAGMRLGGLSILAIAFIPLLVCLCVKGIGVKEWVFLILWYGSGVILLCGFPTV